MSDNSVFLVHQWAPVAKYLLAHGYRSPGCAGIMGNMWVESTINPEAVGSGGNGLIAWTPARRGYVTGNVARDLRVQLRAVLRWNDQNGAGPGRMNRFSSAAAAANFYMEQAERPAEPNLTRLLREKAAVVIHRAIVDRGWDASTGGGSRGGGSGGHSHAIDLSQWYENPLRSVHGLFAERIDQGVDYGCSETSPLRTIGKCRVRFSASSGTGWPDGGFVSYELLEGPAAGCWVYVAENITPSGNARVGKTLNKGEVIAYLHPGGANLETGWAVSHSVPEALYHGFYSGAADGTPTRGGVNFNQLLTRLGAPSGTLQFPAGHGGKNSYNGGDGPVLPRTPRGANWPNWYARTIAAAPPLMARLPDNLFTKRDLKAAKSHGVKLVGLYASSGDGWHADHYGTNVTHAVDARIDYGAVHHITGYASGTAEANNFHRAIMAAPHLPGFIAIHIKSEGRGSRPSKTQLMDFFTQMKANMQADGVHVDRGVYLSARIEDLPHMDLTKLPQISGMWLINYETNRTLVYPPGLKSHPGTCAREYTNGYQVHHPAAGPTSVRGLGHVPLSIVYALKTFGLPPNGTGCTAKSGGTTVTYDRGTWAEAFLSALAATDHGRGVGSGTTKQKKARKDAMLAWMSSEHTKARFNPLSAKFSYPGGQGEGGPAGLPKNYSNDGTKNYTTFAVGIDASVQALTATTSTTNGYAKIVAALVAGKKDGSEILSAIRASKWGSHPVNSELGDSPTSGLGDGRGFFTGTKGTGGHSGSGCPSGGKPGTVPEQPPLITHYRLDGIPKEKFKITDDFHAMLYDSHMIDVIVDVYDQDEKYLQCLSSALTSEFGVTAGQVDVQLNDPTQPNSSTLAANTQLSMDLTVSKHAAGDFGDIVWGPSPGGDVGEKGVLHPAHFIKVTYAVYVDRPTTVQFPSKLPSFGQTAAWVDVPVFYGPISMIQADQVNGTIHLEAQGKESLMGLPNTRPWTNMTDEFAPTVPEKATISDLIELIARQFGETKFKLTKTTRRVSFSQKNVTTFTKANGTWAYLQTCARGAGFYLYYDNDGFLTMKPMPGSNSHAASTVSLSSYDPDVALRAEASPSCISDLPPIAWDQTKWYNTAAVYNPIVMNNSLRGARAIIYEADDEIGSKADLMRNNRDRPMTLYIDSQTMLEPSEAVALGEQQLQAAYDSANGVQLSCLPMPQLQLYDRVSLFSQNIDQSEETETVFVPDKWTLPLVPSALMTIGFNIPVRVVTVLRKFPPPHRKGK